MAVRIECGDCLQVLSGMADNSVDAIVTDPPYGLEFMGKEWDAPWKSDRRQVFNGTLSDARESPFGRSKVRYCTGASYGAGAKHMQAFQEWATEIFTECLRVLRPGGHLLAFGGSRTYHRLGCAVEDAGFEIRDQIMWVYGSGFPKSHNGDWGGTALKPAHEPIVLARKPLIGTVEANWRAHGTGALNIDSCRVGTESTRRTVGKPLKGGAYGSDRSGMDSLELVGWSDSGRWPANLIHDGSDEVLAAFPKAAGQQGAVTGDEPSSKTNAVYGAFNGRPASTPRGDTGSAARFFYCAKASKADRGEGNIHPTVKPTELMRYLCRLITPPGGTVLDPFMGSGTTGRAAILEGFQFVGIELNPEYVALAHHRINAALYADIA